MTYGSSVSVVNTALPTTLSDIFFLPKTRFSTKYKNVVLVVMGALFTALAAQIVVHLGFTPVPITGQTFAVLTVGSVLGSKKAMASQSLYWMLGMVGLPFYAGGKGGWDSATGATAGYFVGFIVASGIIGWFADRRQDRVVLGALSAVALGSTAIYLFGALWLAHSLNIPVVLGEKNAVQLGVVPFLAGDFLKMFLAGLIAPAGWWAYYARPK